MSFDLWAAAGGMNKALVGGMQVFNRRSISSGGSSTNLPGPGIEVVSAGGQTTFTVELKPNRTYVFACYMADRAGGPRHAGGKGMVAYVTTPPA